MPEPNDSSLEARPLLHALAGALAGALVGAVDGGLATTAEGLPPLAEVESTAAITLATLLSMGLGAAVGLGAGAAWWAIWRWARGPALKRFALSRRGLLLGGAGIGLLALAVVAYSAFVKPIEWDAIDPRLYSLPPLFAASYAGVLWLSTRPHPAFRVGAVIAAGLALGLSLGGWRQSDEGRGEGLLRVGMESFHSGWLLLKTRLVFDDDGDAFPTALCAADCDCDDTDADVFPGAVDVPDNGVDEDCDGRDLTREELEAFAAVIKPKAAPAPPVETAGDGETPAPPPEPEGPPPNIIFLVVDTLRADHLGMYGFDRPTSARLDALAAQGVIFDQARATGSQTRFSVPPMLTGKYFTEIARTESKWPRVSEEEHLMAERLKEVGYFTAAWHSVGYFQPLYQMDQGFDVYDTSCIGARDPVQRSPTGDYITDRVLRYTERHDLREKAPFFLWIYYSDPHSAYLFHDGFPRWGPSRKDAYDAEIAFTDHHVGRLLDGLEERGLLENTLIVFTSDHGEGLSKEEDHGKRFHGPNLYDEVVRVPLFMVGPGAQAGARVSTPVSLIDLLPTLLEVARIDPDPELRGVSLTPWMRGEEREHPPVFFEKHKSEALPQKGMVMWPWKVILVMPYNRYEIYNLEEDPRERNNLARELPEAERDRLVGLLKYWANHSLEEVEAVKRFR